jgi:hypothetical protein
MNGHPKFPMSPYQVLNILGHIYVEDVIAIKRLVFVHNYLKDDEWEKFVPRKFMRWLVGAGLVQNPPRFGWTSHIYRLTPLGKQFIELWA